MGPTLLPGDVLLFNRQGFFNKLINWKTGSRFTHCEVVIGRDRVFAARNGQGVAFYPVDLKGLALVMRPNQPVNVEKGIKWARDNNVVGQPYDWLGLTVFFYARTVGRENGRMFCSEAATRFLRQSDLDPFPRSDADTVNPRDFSHCPWFDVAWMSEDEAKRAEVI